MRRFIGKPWFGYVLAGVFLLLAVYFFFDTNGSGPLAGGTDELKPAAVTPADAEDVVRFTSTLNLATRMGADTSSQPLFRAGVGQPIDRSVEFKVPRAGQYRLVLQMTDGPFVAQQQSVGEYLEVVREGSAVGQTFTVDDTSPRLGGVKVKLEARGIRTNQPAETAPDAPLTATLYTSDQKKIGEIVLPVERAGLNDAWRWVTFPFDVELSKKTNRAFFVEFTSPSKVTGWALSRVSNGFENVEDHYRGGELLINGTGVSADLTFAVLTRSHENKQPRLLVDETELTFSPLAGEPGWFFSEPVELSEGTHLLIVQSSNPHVSFFRFIFVPESAGEQSFQRQLEAETATVVSGEARPPAKESAGSEEGSASTPTPSPPSKKSGE